MVAAPWILAGSGVMRGTGQLAIVGPKPHGRNWGLDLGHRPSGRSRLPRFTRCSAAPLLVAAIPLIAGIQGLAGPARAFCVGLAYFALLGVIAARKRLLVPTPISLLVFFGLVAAASALTSPDPESTLLRAVSYLALIICAFLAAERTALRQLVSVAFVLLPMSLSALALALLAISPAQVLSARDGFVQLMLPHLSLHPNTLGAVAAVGVVTAFGRATAPAARRWVWLAVLAVEIPVLLLTYSRSSLLDVAVGVLVFAYVVGRATPLLLGAGGIAVVVVATSGDALLSLLLRTQEVGAIVGLSGRRAIWEVALEAWVSHPMRGVGYGEGASSVLESSDIYQSYSVSTTDNFMLDALIETGPIGAIMVFGVYVSTLLGVRAGRRGLIAGEASRRLGAEFAAVCAMILVHALGSGGVGRFHVLAVLLVFSVVGLWRSRGVK